MSCNGTHVRILCMPEGALQEWSVSLTVIGDLFYKNNNYFILE